MRSTTGSLVSDFRKSKPSLKDVVMGLHWDPPAIGVGSPPADLDALCVLFDSRDRVLEVVHPGNPRGANESVVHTGDSKTGASVWDDERIFVFLETLPETVSKLAFIVLSATGRQFDAIPGAVCHVSDQASEIAWAHIKLTSLSGRSASAVAILCRTELGWRLDTEANVFEREFFDELLLLVTCAK